MTDAEATNAATQAYNRLRDTTAGSVGPLVGDVTTMDGTPLPAFMLREWDWVTNLDDPEAAPQMITEVRLTGDGSVMLTIGDQTAWNYISKDPTGKGRYVGAKRVRVRTMKKATFATWWHWKYQGYYKKHHKYPAMPKGHSTWQKNHRVPVYSWKDEPGSYQ